MRTATVPSILPKTSDLGVQHNGNSQHLAVLSDIFGRSRFYSFNIHTKYRESCDKPILTKRGIPRC